jgi:hypothetical protein
LVVAMAILAGCDGPRVTVDDAVALDNRAMLVGYVEPSAMFGMTKGLSDVRVNFYALGRAVGSAVSDAQGRAVAVVDLPPGTRQFEGRADVTGHDVSDTGVIYNWRKDKTIIAIDIDDTLAKTDYVKLIFSNGDGASKLLDNARPVIQSLAPDYQILYITVRPRFLMDKTRAWMASEQLPAGPLVGGLHLGAVFDQVRQKRESLAQLRGAMPNLLIGLGDKDADVVGYHDSRMLALILGPADGESASLVRRKDWREIGAFFAAHHDTLSDPGRLNDVLGQGQRTGFRWDK